MRAARGASQQAHARGASLCPPRDTGSDDRGATAHAPGVNLVAGAMRTPPQATDSDCSATVSHRKPPGVTAVPCARTRSGHCVTHTPPQAAGSDCCATVSYLGCLRCHQE